MAKNMLKQKQKERKCNNEMVRRGKEEKKSQKELFLNVVSKKISLEIMFNPPRKAGDVPRKLVSNDSK